MRAARLTGLIEEVEKNSNTYLLQLHSQRVKTETTALHILNQEA